MISFFLASSEERECGCSSLALVGGKESVAKQIINKRLVRTLAPLMLDTNISVQHAAVGALRNISLSDPSTCDHMVEQDVFTTLWNLLGQFQALDWQPCQKTTGIDSKTEIFVEAINLLWNLCEANEKVVKKCLDQDIVRAFMKYFIFTGGRRPSYDDDF